MGKLVEQIKNEHLIPRLLCLVTGAFIITFLYNKFLVPIHIVAGGVSGLAIVVQEVFGISTTTFINVSNVILVLSSFLFLGKKRTFMQLTGTAVYMAFINITAPLAAATTFNFESDMLMLIIVTIFWGIGNGLIYRAGYSTGGTDYISEIISNKFHIPFPNVSLVIHIAIILVSALVLGIPIAMLSVFLIFLSNKINNAILFGVSTSKMIYVISKENAKIEEFIMNEFKNGATEIKVKSGVLGEKKQMLMCVVHNAQYAKFKAHVLELDSDAFIASNNCYQVSGGVKLNILPF